LTNTVQLNYSDTLGNAYPPVEATDINQTPAVGPDLTINKTDGGITTAPGAVVPYTLAYANVSPTGATGVVITDPVPANTTFNATASAPTVWSCPDGSPAGTICTTTIGAVAGNSNSSVIFALTLNNPLPPGVTQISNTASIGDDGANGPDPTPGNNVATDDTPIGAVPPPDLTLTKTDNGVTTAPGAVVPYTLDYANVSSTGATGVVITDPVPINATFNATGSAPTVWSCPDGSPAGTVCTTTVGSVAGNSSGSVTFALKVNDPLPAGVTGISNTASIGDDGANGADPTPGNNATAENTPINLAPTKGDDDDEGGTDDRAPSPPSPGGSAGEFAPVSPPEVEPTPILPVLLLPETGLREAQIGAGLRGALPWLAALGLTLASLALWQKAKRRK
jgi:uncharacterized repeat protein (TIGR01451 family)